ECGELGIRSAVAGTSLDHKRIFAEKQKATMAIAALECGEGGIRSAVGGTTLSHKKIFSQK
ncbi:MAG TPA: hypothetical protein VFO37_05690, partial [Chitinophagaceae bacterium]|nr:hypothetical protein [Chitinophagaceae bacterium]